MKSSLLILLVILVTIASATAAEFDHLVLIYGGQMPELAEGVKAILSESSTDGEEFIVLTDPYQTMSMLGLPNVRCLILTPVSSNDLFFLADPVIGYFENGGSAIGFHGSCWQNNLGDMARHVFPIYGNSTGIGARKGGLSVNEYVKNESIGGIGDTLPGSFDLVGQFFAVPKDKTKVLVEPIPPDGTKTVLYRDRKSEAPLVVVYEGRGGGRSVAFAGLFVRNNPTTGNHYEKLLSQPEFSTLLLDSYSWAIEGNSRFNTYSETYEGVIEEGRRYKEELIARAEERDKSRKDRRTFMLLAFWILGFAVIAGLFYWAFVRSRS
jgi:hypothetical protein